MKKLYCYFIILVALSLSSQTIHSQNDNPVQLGADLMSRYIWRGIDLGGESPSIQPSVKFAWDSKNTDHTIILGVWGAYNFNTVNQEADIYLTYTYKGIVSLTATDYYFPGSASYSDEQQKYFNYGKYSTGHVIEPAVSFNGTDKIPFTLLFAMNIYGADARKVNDDGSRGDILMSKYLELGYKKSFTGVDFNAFIGAVLDDPEEERIDSDGIPELGYYGSNESAGIINLGIKVSKSIKVTNDFALPVQGSIITNPMAETFYIVFGFSL